MTRYILKTPRGKFWGDAYKTKSDIDYPNPKRLWFDTWKECEQWHRLEGYRIVKVSLKEIK